MYIDTSTYLAHRQLESFVDQFGPGQLIFGSRLPLYTPGTTLAVLATARISDDAKLAIAGGTLQGPDFGGDPTPQLLLSTPDEPLRAAGVSGNKIKALRDLAARTLDGTVPVHAAIRKMSDDEIVERLTAVRGIGSWTVEMLLIFRLGRPDVLPITDYGVRKGFALTFQRVPKSRPLEAGDLPKPEVVLRRGKSWAPYRSVASWYLWRACDLAKKTAPTGRSAR